MDTPDNAASALGSIDTVAFKVGMRGYNVDEVDEFLERVAAEARQLRDQLAQQRQQLRQAAERINQLESGRAASAPAPAPVSASPAPAASSRGAEQVSSMIAMAQQFIEHAQAEAEAKARELTTAAQERAREIIVEARSRAEDEVNRLNGLKQRLSEDVDKLARQLESERTRLAGVLSEFSRWVDTAFHVSETSRPSSSAPASPPLAAPAPGPSAPPSAPPPAPGASVREVPSPTDNAGPATAPQQTIGQVLNFEPREDRS